jgi:hypothetical protein
MDRTVKQLVDEDGGMLRIRRVSDDAVIVEQERPDGSWEPVEDREAMRALERAYLELLDEAEILRKRDFGAARR